MESNSKSGKIQLSTATADLLFAAGKGDWLVERQDKVMAKGKGEMQCYWLEIESQPALLLDSADDEETSAELEQSLSNFAERPTRIKGRQSRLVDWLTERILVILKQIAARRNAATVCDGSIQRDPSSRCVTRGSLHNEVEDEIALPTFRGDLEKIHQDPENFELDSTVEEQLRDYITTICLMHRKNYYHNL